MHPYGIEFYVQERQRQLNLEVEQQRLWEAARRKTDADVTRSYRPRVRVIGALRRFVQIAWAW